MPLCIENLQNDMKNKQIISRSRNFLEFRIKYEAEQLIKWEFIKICQTLKTDSN